MPRIIIEVDTDYPHRFVDIEAVYDKDGFNIGTIHSVEPDRWTDDGSEV